ncbi:hypothetical protein [Bacillus manliponensis]
MNQHSLQRKFVLGERLPYLGRHYRLQIIKSSDLSSSSFRFQQGQFQAYV